MLTVLERVLRLRTQERTSKSANKAVVVLGAEHAAADTAGYGTQEATLALLRVVGVLWVAIIAVGIAGVAGRGWALTPRATLIVVRG